ncbi:hypothetical protein AVEN_242459-1 [Araneus ventricosus]|uniref:Uncharacterized protein n=1 Tax=Araneus ventricosus TaxID=182803 RepID=A0A4Y2J7R8_ARAVE|nr:hypothetical protein AVEN_242459-1 [Araneus ventricosus]
MMRMIPEASASSSNIRSTPAVPSIPVDSKSYGGKISASGHCTEGFRFDPHSTEDPSYRWAWCTLSLPSGVKRSPGVVVRKIGESVACSSAFLVSNAAQNYEVPKISIMLL